MFILGLQMRVYQTLSILDDMDKIKRELDLLDASSVYGIRFNFGKYSDSELNFAAEKTEKIVREYSQRYKFLLDFPYPKKKTRIRAHTIRGDFIREGQEYLIVFSQKFKASEQVIVLDPITLEDSWDSMPQIVLYGDGSYGFRIIEYSQDFMRVIALRSGYIYVGKSINLGYIPSSDLFLDTIGKMVSSCANYCSIALSFVEHASEVTACKINGCEVISKIESTKGVENIQSILDVSDGIMVARGDLGLNIELGKFYKTVKYLVNAGRRCSKKVYYATDILKSLDQAYWPSRAEIMDIGLMCEMKCTDIILPFRKQYMLDSICMLNRIIGKNER